MIENINLEKKYCMYMQVQHGHLEAGFLFYVFIIFLVYSPASKRNLALRNQIPLKLGYALTIHKSQGMTIER
jgi:hypothetical protein